MLNEKVLLNFAKEEQGQQLLHVVETIGSYLTMMATIKEIKEYPDTERDITLQDAVSKASKRLSKAVFRILQYNSLCREATGEAFITRKVNRSSVADCQKLVRNFVDAVLVNSEVKGNLHNINAA